MEIDYIFPRRIFSSKKSAHAKILTEWKTAFRVFSTELTEINIYDIKSRRPRSQILTCFIIQVLFKEKNSPSEKLVIV